MGCNSLRPGLSFSPSIPLLSSICGSRNPEIIHLITHLSGHSNSLVPYRKYCSQFAHIAHWTLYRPGFAPFPEWNPICPCHKHQLPVPVIQSYVLQMWWATLSRKSWPAHRRRYGRGSEPGHQALKAGRRTRRNRQPLGQFS